MREPRAFAFLRMNWRQLKPRTVGLTEFRGLYYSVVGRRYLEDLFEGFGAKRRHPQVCGRVVQPDAAQGAGRPDRTLSPEPGQGLHRLLPTRLANLLLTRLG